MIEEKKALRVIAWLVALIIHGIFIYLTPNWAFSTFMIGTLVEALFLISVLAAIESRE